MKGVKENKKKVYIEAKVYIDEITFNDGNKFHFDNSDIVVFTGPNNSGKSQVLRDINNFFSNNRVTRIVATDIESNFVGDLESLENKCINKGGRDYFDGIDIYSKDYIKSWWEDKNISRIHQHFVNHLTTESRLKAADPANGFDVVNDTPQASLQKLYIDDKKESDLSMLFNKAFGLDMIVNRCAGINIPLHIGHTPPKEAGEDRASASYLKKLNLLPQIQTQGDGMRSFAGILLNIFTSNHSITLIDEPEAFLHPPQARLLGKMIAHNTPTKRQIFISTHSEDFLKGLLDADIKNVKIIRINRIEKINHMNILNNEDISRLWEDSILRYSNILSGLFHSKVVICESDTDCRFYQAITNSIHDDNSISPDILFTHCGGKQRLKVVIRALKSLNVKTVAITDIDVLNDKNTFKDIAEACGINWDDIEKKWKIIDLYVKEQRAQLDTEDVKKGIKDILEQYNEPQISKDIAYMIKNVIKQSSAWSKVKETGKSFLVGEAYKSFNELYDKCKTNGLLIVPVGELECFYKPDSNHGVKWVNNVLETVNLKDDPELTQARSFINELLSM